MVYASVLTSSVDLLPEVDLDTVDLGEASVPRLTQLQRA